MLATVQVEEALLALKIAFLLLLYLFIWRIVRAASRDLRMPQESFVLAPQPGKPAVPAPARNRTGRLVVVSSPAGAEGAAHVLNSVAFTLGRDRSELGLAQDDYVSAQHARVEPRPDGVWVQDLGSTNGTFVNGDRLSKPRLLEPGDVIRVGQTDLRFEPEYGGSR